MNFFPSYTIQEFLPRKAKIDDFLIHRLENLDYFPPSTIVSPHKHLFYEVLVVKKGKAIHHVDFKTYHVGDYQLLFIAQGQLHQLETVISETLIGYRIVFSEEFFQYGVIPASLLFELMYVYHLYDHPVLKIPKENPLFPYFELMLNEHERSNFNLENIQLLLFLCLNELERLVGMNDVIVHKRTNVSVRAYKDFLATVEENFALSLSIDDYAEKVNLSSRQLSRLVKKVSNNTLNNIVVERRILEAKRLLKYSKKSIAEISYKIGYKEPAYFSKVFKRATGKTPNDFRGG